MRFTDICKTYIDRADISLSHQMDFETYLRNHAKEIINLVEAAELQNKQWNSPLVSEALASLNKEPPKEIDPNKWAFDRKLESY